MEYLVEFILELVLEGGLEVSKSSKVPKPIRYIILGIIGLFIIAVIGLLYVMSFIVFKKSIIVSVLIFLLATIMLVSIIIKFRKEYLTKINNK